MATRKVKAAPTEGNITKKQAKKAVREVMLSKDDFMNKPPEEFVEPEMWTQNAFNSYIEMLLEDYPKGNDFYKKHTWSDVNEMIDDVLSGKIVVDNKSAVVV